MNHQPDLVYGLDQSYMAVSLGSLFDSSGRDGGWKRTAPGLIGADRHETLR